MFNIRYLSLKFTIRFEQPGRLPASKVPAIRGGIGNMLLMGNCMEAGKYESGNKNRIDYHVPDSVCEKCVFHEECPVRRIYYHPYRLRPEYVQEKGNVGYLYECTDAREKVSKGDTLSFYMKLFGDVVIHFPLILQAVYQLGLAGLGTGQLRFSLVSVVNHRGEPVLSGNNVCLGYIRPDFLSDYISRRLSEHRSYRSGGKSSLKIRFAAPWTQKYQGEFLREFHADAFVDAVYRRVYLLHCFEGIVMERKHPFQKCMHITEQQAGKKEVLRYSATQGKKIYLNGLLGEFVLGEVPDEFLPYIYAGEFLHIGKNCSMGFGQYHAGFEQSPLF